METESRESEARFLEMLAKAHEVVLTQEDTCDEQLLTCSKETDVELAVRLEGAEACLRLLERMRRQGCQPSHGSDLPGVPTSIGRFQIQRFLGEGAYGVVYLALDPRLNRRVALKIPRAAVAISPELRERFIHEAGMAARVEHDNIVRVYEAGQTDDFYYIASEYCEGPTLESWLNSRSGSLPVKDAAQMVGVLADGVAHAHSRGILHRDLKPANVLLATDLTISQEVPLEQDVASAEAVDIASVKAWIPKITDFGLAKIEGDDHRRTATNAIVGTPSYMAPEQAAGNAAAVGTASDVYALGVILYQLLTGRVPFDESTVAATLEAVRSHQPQPPSRVRDGLPRDLDAICLKCLEKKPEARYRSAAELGDDLRRFVDGLPVQARSITLAERLVRWSYLNPLLASLVASVVLLTVLMVAGSLTAVVLLADANRKTRDHLLESIASERRSLTSSFDARVSQAALNRNTGMPGQAFETLAVLDMAIQDAKRLGTFGEHRLRLRNQAIAAMTRVDVQPAEEWPDDSLKSGQFCWLAMDSTADRYARLEHDGEIVIRRLQDNREVQRVPGLGRVNGALFRGGIPKPLLRFSPDGRLLAVRGIDHQNNVRVQLWDLEQLSQPLLDEPAGGQWRDKSVDFSADGNWLAFVAPGNTVVIRNVKTSRVRNEMKLDWTPNWIRCSPDGRYAAAPLTDADSSVFVCQLDVPNQEIKNRFKMSYRPDSACWSPDGRRLAVCTNSKQSTIWDVSTGRQVLALDHPDSVFDLVFDVYGEWLLACGFHRSWLWDSYSGERLLELDGPAITISRDRHFVGYGRDGESIGRWRLTPRDEISVLPGNRHGMVLGLDFSLDGSLLVSIGDGAHIWHVDSTSEVAHLDVQADSAVFSPDGSCLAVSDLIGGTSGRWPIAQQAGTSRFGPAMISTDFTSYSNPSRLDFGDVKPFALLSYRPWPVVLDNRESANLHAISPNERWLVTSPAATHRVHVWNAHSGELACELETLGGVRTAGFSPDDTLLFVASYQGYAIYQAGTWKALHRIPREPNVNAIAKFAGDSRVIAATFVDSVKLFNAETGNELASLKMPPEIVRTALAISSDGCRLAVGTESGRIHLWKLERIRERLSDLDLDWDLQPCAERVAATNEVELLAMGQREAEIWRRRSAVGTYTTRLTRNPEDVQSLWRRAREFVGLQRWDEAIEDCTLALQLQTDCQDAFFWRGMARVNSGHDAEAATDFRRSLAIRPDDDWCCRQLAWIYVGGPPELRNASEARRLVEAAIQIARKRRRVHQPLCLALLGMAQFRLNEFAAALRQLDEAIAAGAGDTRVLLFKAMCHAQLGDRENALRYFGKAIDRIDDASGDDLGSVKYIRVEAEQLLEITPNG